METFMPASGVWGHGPTQPESKGESMHWFWTGFVAGWLVLYGCGPQPVDLEAEREALERVRALHRSAHFHRDAERMVATFSDDMRGVQNGEVVQRSREEHTARLQRYFDQSTFEAWDDLVPPHIRISPDGRMAYVIVQKRVALRARGDGEAGPIHETIFAWLETWEKVDGEWRLTANASTRRNPAAP